MAKPTRTTTSTAKEAHPERKMVSVTQAMENSKTIVRTYPIPTDCATSNYPRLIHSHETWHFLQNTYKQLCQERGLSVRSTMAQPGTGMQLPFQVRDNGPRGRTLHTLVDVPKGTRLWKSDYHATFHDEETFTAYLQRLPHDLQCDVLLWAYPEKHHSSVGLALDEGSYMNHGENQELLTVDIHCAALRDLKAGEEILEDYGEFIGTNEVQWFDKLRAKAWGEAKKEQQVRVGDNGKVEKQYVSLGVPKPIATTVSYHHHRPEPARLHATPDLESMLNAIEFETAQQYSLAFSAVVLLSIMVIFGRVLLHRTKGIHKRN
jgi:hypothetical protein